MAFCSLLRSLVFVRIAAALNNVDLKPNSLKKNNVDSQETTHQLKKEMVIPKPVTPTSFCD